MRKLLQNVALLFVIAPLSAMVFEPFYKAVLDILHIKPEELAGPVMTAIFDALANDIFRYASFMVIGLGIGALAYSWAIKFDQSREPVIDPFIADALATALGTYRAAIRAVPNGTSHSIDSAAMKARADAEALIEQIPADYPARDDAIDYVQYSDLLLEKKRGHEDYRADEKTLHTIQSRLFTALNKARGRRGKEAPS